jgi:biopolymer transport protein ExbD
MYGQDHNINGELEIGHSVRGSYQAPEPNLTPLLDMVLQLIMFFMICVSLVGRESDFELRLPVMQHACPPEPAGDQLVLNVDRAGALHVSNRPPLESDSDILSLLNGWAKVAEHGGIRATPLIVIRADTQADYRKVHHLMTLCKKAGLTRFQLRTVTAS